MTFVLVFLASTAVTYLLFFEGRRRPSRKDGMNWIEYGTSVRTVAVCSGIGLVWMLLNVPGQYFVLRASAACLWSLVVIPLVGVGFFWRVGFNDDGLDCHSPWQRRRRVRWTDVLKVDFSGATKQWLLRTRSQGAVRVNELAPGIDYLLTELKRRGIPVVEVSQNSAMW